MEEIQDYKMGDFATLYHYTSADGLKSIIENKTICFSDYRFLNDIDEIEYGKKVFRQVLDELKTETPQCSPYVSLWEKDLENTEQGKLSYLKPISLAGDEAIKCLHYISENLHYYLLSLTTLGDNKDMWNMYSGNNPCYRIKINENELINYFYDICDSFIHKGLIFF